MRGGRSKPTSHTTGTKEDAESAERRAALGVPCPLPPLLSTGKHCGQVLSTHSHAPCMPPSCRASPCSLTQEAASGEGCGERLGCGVPSTSVGLRLTEKVAQWGSTRTGAGWES